MLRNRLLPGLVSGLLVVTLALSGCGKNGGDDLTGPRAPAVTPAAAVVAGRAAAAAP